MELIGRRLSAKERQGVLDDPTMVDRLLYADLDDEDAKMPEPDLDIDKAWRGIHYLLTGSAWEIGEGVGGAILGGDAIGEDNGYGPATYLMPHFAELSRFYQAAAINGESVLLALT